MVLCDAVTVWDRDCRDLDLDSNQLTGTIPKSFLALKYLESDGLHMSQNLLTGNATFFVDTFDQRLFWYNCFDPAVPPSNPSC
jgi:hypothetical protein